MLKLSVVKTALANQLTALVVPQLTFFPKPQDSMNPPFGLVMPARNYVDYGITLQGSNDFLGDPAGGHTLSPTDISLDVVLAVSHASTLDRLVDEIDLWIGVEEDATAVSVMAALAEDPTLGGAVAWCIPSSADQPRPMTWAGMDLFGTRVHLNLSVS